MPAPFRPLNILIALLCIFISFPPFLLFALNLYFGYTFTRGTQKEQKFFLRVPPNLLPSENTSLRFGGFWFPLPSMTIQFTQPLLNQLFFHSQLLLTYPCQTDLVSVLAHQKGKRLRAISFCFCDHHFLAAAVDHLY